MILIKNGKILTMTGTDFDNGYVLVDGGKIAAVGQEIQELLDRGIAVDDVKIVDAGGGYILPGFIDAHCHVGLWEDSVGFEGDDINEMTDPATPHLRAIDGVYHADRAIEEARESGVTTVVTGPGSGNVIGGQFAALKTYGRRIEEMVLKEPIAMKAAFGENPKTIYNEKHQAPMTRMAIAAILRENLMKAKEYKEAWDEYNREPEENDKPELDMKLEALTRVLTGEIPLKMHAHRADDILTAIRIAKEFGVRYTIDHCTEGHLIVDILVEEGAQVIVGPSLTDRSKIELRNRDLRTPGILARAGLKVAIMTDHPCTPVNFLLLCAAMAAKEGMEEYEALKAITINAAEIVGISDRVGSIEPGKDADIAVFNGHPFDLRSHVQYTLINGNIVYERK